jgi:site-specific DNA-methyltransferase (adenine-specific)
MAREETFGDCRLILGDCLDPALELGEIDGWVGDPPYAFNNSGGGKYRKARRKGADAIVRHGLDKGFDLAALGLGDPRSVVVFCHNDQLVTLLPILAGRFHRHAVLSVHKTNPPPFANKHYLADTEFYIHAWNEGAHPVGKRPDLRRWCEVSRPRSEFDHPTVKPLPVMLKVVRNMNARRILDPFMGTGTTGEACLIEGRSFVGIEKDPVFFDMACRRLDQRQRWLAEVDQAFGEVAA